MKVKDLIELLQPHDKEKEVEVFCQCEGVHVIINSVEIQTREATDESTELIEIVAIVEDE